MRTKILAAAALTLLTALPTTAVAHADPPSITDQVCTGFNLGMTPDQIIAGLQRNDGRYNYWTAQRATVWPIIDGECG
jgi:hypothetical protein